MSWGTIIKTNNGSTYVSRIRVNSYQDVQAQINEELDFINELKVKLKQLAACTPKDMFPSTNSEDTFFQINREFDELWESIDDSYNKLARLQVIEGIANDWKYADENALDIEIKENWDKICIND